MTVNLGGNDFFGVPIPLQLGDRFFAIRGSADRLSIDVFRWDPRTATAVYEVRDSTPIEEAITTNPTGTVTFSEPETGRFLFKFRPKPGVSQVFGRIAGTDGFDVWISDTAMRVKRGDDVVATLERSAFVGVAIGVQVGVDGSVAMGVSELPNGMVLEP